MLDKQQVSEARYMVSELKLVVKEREEMIKFYKKKISEDKAEAKKCDA